MKELSDEEWREYRQEIRQNRAEGWIEARRTGSGLVEVRPASRLDDIHEGERIDPDQWLVREGNGETYVVSRDTFESEFETNIESEEVAIDLSFDDVETDEFSIEGESVIVVGTAYINRKTDMIRSIDIDSTYFDDYIVDGGMPLEVVADSPRINDTDDDEVNDDE